MKIETETSKKYVIILIGEFSAGYLWVQKKSVLEHMIYESIF